MHALFTIAYVAAIIALCLLFSDSNPFAKTHPDTLEAMEALETEEGAL